MKKILAVCAAATLCFSPVCAQEAEDSGPGVELSVIPRFELTPVFSEGTGNLTLGNSSLYSLFEGNILNNLSFSIENHWLSSSPAELYRIEGEGANVFRSDWTNWLDWAYLSLELGNFSVSAGKDMITTGGFEFDEYDYDVHPILSSGLWNYLSCYQWGGKVAYTSNSGNTELSLQCTSSPYCEHPFSEGLFYGSVVSLGWRGEYGPWRNIWSVSYLPVETEGGNPSPMLVCLANRFDIGDFSLGLDWYSRSGSEEAVLCDGSTILASLDYSPSDELSFSLKVGKEKAESGEFLFDSDGNLLSAASKLGDNLFGGISISYFPVENLRLHAVGAYSSFEKTAAFSIGATCYLRLLK